LARHLRNSAGAVPVPVEAKKPVISHLAGLVGSSVKVTLEIEATVEAGAPENVVRTVTENSRTLKFTTHGFEEE